MVFLIIIIMLISSGAFLPRPGRVIALIFALTAFLLAAFTYRRDGAWTFIHNDVGMMLLGVIGGSLAIGALARETVTFVSHRLTFVSHRLKS